MRNENLKLKIKNAIELYMEAKISFTSLDICNFVRNNNPGHHIPMKRISHNVRKYALNISTKRAYMYQATFIEIDNTNGSLTYLYHHIDFDPANYLSRDLISLKTI